MLAAFLFTVVGAGGTSGGLVWRLSTGSETASFALADRGGQVFVDTPSRELVLLSAHDSSTSPVWGSRRRDPSSPIRGSSASDVVLRNVVRLLDDEGLLQSFLHLRASGSPTPVWSYSFAPMVYFVPAYDVSADGRTIVSAFAESDLTSPMIRLHDPETGVVLREFEAPVNHFALFELSPDGSILGLTQDLHTGSRTRIIDLRSGLVSFATDGRLTGKQAISRDGGVFAVSEGDSHADWVVRVFARGPAGYRLVLERESRGDVWPEAVAVSDDGSTVAATWFDRRYPTRAIVRAFDVVSGAQTMEDVAVAQSLQDPPNGLAISADGSRFVVGSWGDGAGSIAELAVYAKDRDAPLVEHAPGGSVMKVEISPDGDRFAASRLSTHIQQQGSREAFVELYELGGEDLAVRGRPSIGSTIALEAHVAPGTTAYLLSARALAPTPIDVPGAGVLYLEPRSLARRRLGTVPPSGVVSVQVTIPSDSAAVGKKFFYQVLATHPRALGRDFAQVTILP